MNITRTIDIAAVVRGYAEAILWSASCNGTAPAEVCTDCAGEDCDQSLSHNLNYDVSQIDADSMAAIRKDVTDFVNANMADLIESGLPDDYIGHNFYLNRCGHGTGFWDRGLGAVGDRLSNACTPYGETYAYATGIDTVGVA